VDLHSNTSAISPNFFPRSILYDNCPYVFSIPSVHHITNLINVLQLPYESFSLQECDDEVPEGEKNNKKGGLNCVFGNFFFYVLENCSQVQSLK